METKHTPGPWEISEEPSCDAIRKADETARLICEFPYGAFDTPADTANARLIAAAPDLLAACKLALLAFETRAAIDWDELAQAIEKATGGKE